MLDMGFSNIVLLISSILLIISGILEMIFAKNIIEHNNKKRAAKGKPELTTEDVYKSVGAMGMFAGFTMLLLTISIVIS